jgi:DNA-binding transcriptional MerR regulator
MSITSQAGLAFESDSAADCPETESEALFAKSAEAFRTIGEAATELGLKTHVLRFWETKFDNLRPMKRPDGRRFYRPEDMEMLRHLQNLLHVQGLTIRGAIKALGDGPGVVPILEGGVSEDGAEEMILPEETGASVRDLQDTVREAVERGDFRAPDVHGSSTAKARLESLLSDLTNLKLRLDTVRTAA